MLFRSYATYSLSFILLDVLRNPRCIRLEEVCGSIPHTFDGRGCTEPIHTDWNRFTLEVPFDDTSYLSIDTSIHAPSPMQEHCVFVDDMRFNIGSHFIVSTSANQWHAFMTSSLQLARLPKVIFTFDGHGAANVMADRKSTRLNSSHSGESRMPSSA